MPAAPSPLRGRISFVLKLVLAVGLITWLVRSGSLDFRALEVFVTRPMLLASSIALTAITMVGGAARWAVLLRLARVEIPFRRALQLQLTALFFNLAIPGGVGGDVIKSAYAAREARAGMKPTVFVVAFVERLLGLGALVIVAGIVILLRGPSLWSDPQLRPMALTVAALAGATVVGPIVLIALVRLQGHRLEAWTGGTTRIAKLSSQLVAAARLVSDGPRSLFVALVMSMAIHALALGFFTYLSIAITAQDIPFSSIATVYPLGILTIVVPISPGGIGVGHVAFARLFAVIGLTGGASVFNAFLISQTAPNLIGVFPYLTLKRSHALPTTSDDGREA